MGVFAYTRKTFSSVLNDVRISYYTHRLNAQALAEASDGSIFNEEDKKNVTSITFKLWLESIKETIFAYTLPIFHIIKLPIFLTVAAFSEVFNGLKADFNYFFRRNKNNSQQYTAIDNEIEALNNLKDYSLNKSIENYFKPQLITAQFSIEANRTWADVTDIAMDKISMPIDLCGLDYKEESEQNAFSVKEQKQISKKVKNIIMNF